MISDAGIQYMKSRQAPGVQSRTIEPSGQAAAATTTAIIATDRANVRARRATGSGRTDAAAARYAKYNSATHSETRKDIPSTGDCSMNRVRDNRLERLEAAPGSGVGED
jgi:hypothetical protein